MQKDSNGFVVTEQLTDYFAHARPERSLSMRPLWGKGWAMPGRDRLLTSNEYRFAYQGIEQDFSTGNHFFTLRTYDARTARWTNPDPMMQYYSPYLAMDNNPVSMIDPTGGESGLSFTMDPVAFGFSALSMAAGALLSSGGNDAGGNAGGNAGAAPGFDPDDTRFLVPDAAGASAVAQVVAPEAYIIGGLLQANVAAMAGGTAKIPLPPFLKKLLFAISPRKARNGVCNTTPMRRREKMDFKVKISIKVVDGTQVKGKRKQLDMDVRDGMGRDLVMRTPHVGGLILINEFDDKRITDILLIEDAKHGNGIFQDPDNRNTANDIYASPAGPDGRRVGGNNNVGGTPAVYNIRVAAVSKKTRVRVLANVNGSNGRTEYVADISYAWAKKRTIHREWLFGFIPLFWTWRSTPWTPTDPGTLENINVQTKTHYIIK